MRIIPINFDKACQFVQLHHRHNKKPIGHKFSIGLQIDGKLVGVAMVGRPIARHFDNGLTCEVNRTCTDGSKNANSMLYGACWRAAKAMGYTRCITYTPYNESGESLRAAGWVRVKTLKARKSWAEATGAPEQRAKRDPIGNGGVERILWEVKVGQGSKPAIEAIVSPRTLARQRAKLN